MFCGIAGDDGEDLYALQSVNVKEEFPEMDDVDREALFSKIMHYPPPKDLEEKSGNIDGRSIDHRGWQKKLSFVYTKVEEEAP